jgi:hypothetical protein
MLRLMILNLDLEIKFHYGSLDFYINKKNTDLPCSVDLHSEAATKLIRSAGFEILRLFWALKLN